MTELYLISPPEFEIEDFIPKLQAAFKGGDIPVFQLRLKNTPRERIIEAAKKIIPICRENDALFIINDDLEIALETGADGVHFGQEDFEENKISIKDIKKKHGDGFLVGISCHDSKELAFKAGEAGADYVSFGAFFNTKTKENPKGKPSLELLNWWSVYTNVPVVAIGGINTWNIKDIAKNGADFAAVISSVWDHEKGPEYAVKELNSAIAKALNS